MFQVALIDLNRSLSSDSIGHHSNRSQTIHVKQHVVSKNKNDQDGPTFEWSVDGQKTSCFDQTTCLMNKHIVKRNKKTAVNKMVYFIGIKQKNGLFFKDKTKGMVYFIGIKQKSGLFYSDITKGMVYFITIKQEEWSIKIKQQEWFIL